MAGLTTWFGWSVDDVNSGNLPDLYPMGLQQSIFVKTDLENTYAKILIDVLERTEGIADDVLPMLWDNCVQGEASDGLISLLACAMAEKQDLFLVYDPALKLLRKAKPGEAEQIRRDYAKTSKSSVGVFVSFKNYLRTDMIKFYSTMEYCAVSSLNKSMNLSKAIQYKISELRSSVGLKDAAEAKAQAVTVAEALSNGKDVMLDAKDMIETSKPDLEATKEAMLFLDSKRCFYLGFPLSYITGEAPKGLGDSGEGDARAIERGLKNYYFSIIKPVIEAVFESKTTFKSHDFRQLDGALNALKTFDLISDEFISKENKLLIINKLLDVESELGQEPKPEPAPVIVAPGQPKPEPPKAPNA